MFRLRRYFSIVSLVASIGVAALLVLFYRQTALNNLVQLGESKNVALTQSFANSLWPQSASFMNSSSSLSGDKLRARLETARLRQAVLSQMADPSVRKVKVCSLQWLTAFSIAQS